MELVKCDHCGKVIEKEDAAICTWEEINLTWYYCKECDKSLSPRKAGGYK